MGVLGRTARRLATGVEETGRDPHGVLTGAQLGEALKRKQKKRTGRDGMVSRVVRPGSVC